MVRLVFYLTIHYFLDHNKRKGTGSPCRLNRNAYGFISEIKYTPGGIDCSSLI